MATRAPQVATIEGGSLTLYPAAAGDKVSGVRRPTRMTIYNASASPVTLTVAVPGNTSYGEPNPAKPFTIPAGAYYQLTLLPEYRNPADANLVALTWSATASVSWAVIG